MMPSSIDPRKLRPHPANTVFDPLAPEVYQALQEDIAAHGIHDALMVTPDLILISGHHRAKIAVELGLATVPIEIQDVDATEAERLLIADNVLRRQLNPMEQARLIQRLQKEYGIKAGNPQFGAREIIHNNSDKMSELTLKAGVTNERQAQRLNQLNKLIPPLQALVSSGQLGTSHGAALAILEAAEQEALYEAVGDAVATLKVADIQAAKHQPDTQALTAQITTLQAERDRLQTQLRHAETATAQAPDPALLEALRDQLTASEETAQHYADELARLQAQSRVERIVEKIVPDPATVDQLQQVEQTLKTLRAQYDQLQEKYTAVTAVPTPPASPKQSAAPGPEEVTLVNRLEILRREIGMAERELGRRRTGLEFMGVGRTAIQQMDKARATLEALAAGELDSLIPPEILSWSGRLRQMADWLERLVHQPSSQRVVDIHAYSRD